MKALHNNNEYDVSMPPPNARWSRPPVTQDEIDRGDRVFYATSSGGIFYFCNLTEEQKADWDVINRQHHSENEEEIANELRRHKER